MLFVGLSVLTANAHAQATQAEAGQSHPVSSEDLKFDVISVKPNKHTSMNFDAHFTPNGFVAQNTTPLMLIRLAYSLGNSNNDLFLGYPEWATTETYDIAAKVSDADVDRYTKLSREEKRSLVQKLLRDRFQLMASKEVRQGDVYALSIAKGGVKLKTSDMAETSAISEVDSKRGHLFARGVQMPFLVSMLTQRTGITVVDETGLKGFYNVQLDWNPDDSGRMVEVSAENADKPTIFVALQEQLGLKLTHQKGPVEMLIIARMEHPEVN
jgi:uncharacterized protein (TIGR03435 family)